MGMIRRVHHMKCVTTVPLNRQDPSARKITSENLPLIIRNVAFRNSKSIILAVMVWPQLPPKGFDEPFFPTVKVFRSTLSGHLRGNTNSLGVQYNERLDASISSTNFTMIASSLWNILCIRGAV